MRESIGGAWLFGIVAVFIALFTAFLAYSISYTRAFNTKNEIINIIERKEGYTTSPDLDYNMTLEQLHAMYPIDYERTADVEILMNIKSIGYNYSAARGIDCRSVGHPDGEANEGGYCITKICPAGSELKDSRIYYKVTTFIAIKIPILEVSLKIPISGETKTLYFDVTGEAGCD